MHLLVCIRKTICWGFLKARKQTVSFTSFKNFYVMILALIILYLIFNSSTNEFNKKTEHLLSASLCKRNFICFVYQKSNTYGSLTAQYNLPISVFLSCKRLKKMFWELNLKDKHYNLMKIVLKIFVRSCKREQ